MAGTMSGTVTIRQTTGQPLHAAAVSVNPGSHTTTTGHDGTWNLSLDAGQYELVIKKDGFDQWIGDGIHVVDGADTNLRTAMWASQW